MMKPPPDVSESLTLSTPELMLLVVGLLLTIGVAVFLLAFFVPHHRREIEKERSR
ncbi:MAG: hypothetical protein HN811_07180 [Phycisphaerae bacterium]|nr:hypothetical protein [Phycisphaerae bacterium]